MNKKFYERIYDCIASGQVSSDRIAKYLKDKGFYKYWKKRKKNRKKFMDNANKKSLTNLTNNH